MAWKMVATYDSCGTVIDAHLVHTGIHVYTSRCPKLLRTVARIEYLATVLSPYLPFRLKDEGTEIIGLRKKEVI